MRERLNLRRVEYVRPEYPDQVDGQSGGKNIEGKAYRESVGANPRRTARTER